MQYRALEAAQLSLFSTYLKFMMYYWLPKEWNNCWTLLLEEESPKVKITSLDLKK